MTFKEIEELKEKAKEKNLSFAEQCTQMGKYIQENNIKTIKRSNKNVKITTRK